MGPFDCLPPELRGCYVLVSGMLTTRNRRKARLIGELILSSIFNPVKFTKYNEITIINKLDSFYFIADLIIFGYLILYTQFITEIYIGYSG